MTMQEQNLSLAQKAIDIKGKKYVMVSDRVLAFNELYPKGSIVTEIIPNTDPKQIIIKAIVRPDSEQNRAFVGHAQEIVGNGFINKTSALENAETSAVGRALAMLGIGVLDSIASADEIYKSERNAINTQSAPKNTPQVNFELPTEPVYDNIRPQELVCEKCGSEKVLNPKTGKYFCKNKCWLQNQ